VRAAGGGVHLEGDDRGRLIALAIELSVTQLPWCGVEAGEVTSDHGVQLPATARDGGAIIEEAKGAADRTAEFVDAVPE